MAGDLRARHPVRCSSNGSSARVRSCMATDSYFVSNEAMEKDRHADLLAWLVGANRNVVFDEAHFGIVETSGVAMLMRKYRLHGLAAGLLLLAGLFIWKNASRLVPPHRRTGTAGLRRRQGFGRRLCQPAAPQHRPARSAAGLFCRMEKIGRAGRPALRPRGGNRPRRCSGTENSLPPQDRNPIAAYKRICSILGTHNAPPKS